MRLLELEVRRMPGIDQPFTLGAAELGAGVHVIHGPNGSGKSTLCRAVRMLLWPRKDDPPRATLRARFELDGRAWLVESEAGAVRWQCEGAPALAPSLPEARFAECFTIHADDLGGSEAGQDQDLAAEIARSMAGGYDLRAVRELFEQRAREGQAEAKVQREAEDELTRTREQHAHVASRHEQAGALQAELAAANRAVLLVHALGDARDLLDKRREREAAQAALAGLGGGWEALHGDELQLLEGIARQLAAEDEELAALESAERNARQAALATRLELPSGEPAGAPAGSSGQLDFTARLPAAPGKPALDEQRERLERAEPCERELERARRDADKAQTGRAAALAAFGAGADADRLLALDPGQAGELQVHLAAVAKLAGERAAIEAQLATLAGRAHDPARAEALRAAEAAALRWLRAPATGGASRMRALALAAALALALAFSALALLHHPAWAVGVLLAVVLIVAALRAGPATSLDERASARADLERSGVGPPAAWTPEAVRSHAELLRRELLEADAAILRAEQCAHAQARLTLLAREEQVLEQRRERLRAASGLGEGGDLALADFADKLARLRERDGELRSARALADSAARSLADELERVGRFLAGHGEALPDGVGAAKRALRSLEERAQGLQQAREELERIAERRRAARVRRTRAQSDLEALYARARLATGDEAGLRARVESLAGWRTALQRANEADQAVRLLEQRLEAHPELCALDAGALEVRASEAGALAGRAGALNREIAAIEAEARQLGKGHGLEEALAAHERALDELALARERALHAAAGRFLVAGVAAEHGRVREPLVLARARELFAKVTAHGWRLDVAPGEEGRESTFRALETASGRGHALAELSSGTRAQLLLSARVAFACEVERGARLPLFLDDVLASSDPERGRALAQALLALAQEGPRQAFALTPDPQDAGLFLAASAGAAVKVVDLARLRRLQHAETRVELLTPRPATAIPAPGELAPAAYAERLGVPWVDALAPLESLHLYYVLMDELAVLHRLLMLRLERVGPLREVVRTSGAAAARLDAGEWARASAWIECADSVLRSWRVGRGKPVDREALRQAGVSERFLGGTAEMAAELGGDAKRLLEAIEARKDARIKGFHGSKLAELRQQLAEAGHLDPAPALEREQAWTRLLADLAGVPSAPAADALRARFELLWKLCGGAA